MRPVAARNFGSAREVGWDREVETRDDPYSLLRAWVAVRGHPVVAVHDGRLLCYRAFHTRPHLESPFGEPTGALHGVIEYLQSTGAACGGCAHIVAWDGSRSLAYKRKVFSAYKSRHDRDRTDEELAEHARREEAIACAKRGLGLLGVTFAATDELEADDVAGLLVTAVMLERDGDPGLTVLCTEDKDWYQLVGDDVAVFRCGECQLVDAAAFVESHGFSPRLYADWKALVGESAAGDNIPGVPGFGPVRATNAIRTHGSARKAVEYCLALRASGGKMQKHEEALARHAEDAKKSYRLARIMRLREDLKKAGLPLDAWNVARRAACDAVRGRYELTVEAALTFRARYGFETFDPKQFAAALGGAVVLKKER